MASFSLNSLLNDVGKVKFIYTSASIVSSVMNAKDMFDRKDYFNSGATTGQSLSSTFFLCFGNFLF